MKALKLFLFIATLLLGFQSHAVDLAKEFTFEGVLLNDPSGTPMASPVSTVMFQIYNTSGTCLIFQESHSNVALDVDGAFSIRIGSGTRASGSVDGGLLWRQIFQNDALLRATSSTNCTAGYTPAAYDGRKLRVTVNGTALTPDFNLTPVPMATVAESLQGKVASDFVGTSGAGAINGSLTMMAQSQLRLGDTGSNYVGLRAPATVTTNYQLTLPNTAGANGQCLMTDGTGILSWSSPPSVATLNGISSSAQTFAVGQAGTSPGWSSAGAIHTLNIPLASTAAVTAGLVSKTDYDIFYNKLDSSGGSISGFLDFSTAGSPSTTNIQFQSPTNGIYATGGDIGISTSSVGRVVVTNSGNVGIGTNSPGAMLHVNGPVRIGSAAETSQILGVYNFPGATCAISSLSAGVTGTCSASIGGGFSIGQNVAVNCQPTTAPAYPILSYCYIDGTNSVKIVVKHDGGGPVTIGSWHITITKFP